MSYIYQTINGGKRMIINRYFYRPIGTPTYVVSREIEVLSIYLGLNTVLQSNLLNCKFFRSTGAPAFQTFNQSKYTVQPGNATL